MRCSLLLGCLASALALTTGQDLTMLGGILLAVFVQFSTWLLVCALVVLGFIEYLATLLLKFVRAPPGSHRGAEGGDGDGCASSLSFLAQYVGLSPLVHLQ